MTSRRMIAATILGLSLCGSAAAVEETQQLAESASSSVSRISTSDGATVITSKSDGGTSRVATGKPAPDAFLLTIRITLYPGDSPGRIDFGPYQGGAEGAGYRISCRTGAGGDPALALLRVGADGSETRIATYEGPLRLDDGTRREILWRRDATGRMTVTTGGEELLAARDSRLGGGFDGVVFVNSGGHAEVEELTIEPAGK